MNIFGTIVLVGVLCFVVFETIGFIRDIIKRKKVKKDLENEEIKTDNK